MVVTSPTNSWLIKALEDCRLSLKAASPYVGDYFSKRVACLENQISTMLITRTLLADFAGGSSSLEALISIAERSGGILSLNSLHAKIYIIDSKCALVTSANATYSGMHLNQECGIEVTNAETVKQLDSMIETGFGTIPKPQMWSSAELAALREPVEALRSVVSRRRTPPGMLQPEGATFLTLRRNELDRLLYGLPGWLQLTVEGIIGIKGDTFTMNDVYLACAPKAAAQYPGNKHVRQKLRQQMQRLRDIGLVAFLGKGRYQLLAELV